MSLRTAAKEIKRIDSQAFCINHVKKYDRENYLAALCIEKLPIRRAVFALRAFNVELALVREVTKSPDRAKLRYHFWSKLIEEVERRSVNKSAVLPGKDAAYYNYAPVAKELLDLFGLFDLNEPIKKNLKDLIGARVSSKIIGEQAFENMSELELYCEKSNAPVYDLAWRLAKQIDRPSSVNSENPDSVDSTLAHISKTLGVAHGLSNIIRGIAHNARRDCCYIPESVLSEHKLSQRHFITNNLDGAKIRPVVQSLAQRCDELVQSACRDLAKTPRELKSLYLPNVIIRSYLKTLTKRDYNICDPSLSGRRNVWLPLNIWLASKNYSLPIVGV